MGQQRKPNPHTVLDWIKLSLFTNYPEDYFGIVVIQRDDINGEKLYDGQLRPFCIDPEYKELREMQFKGYLPAPPCIQYIFV